MYVIILIEILLTAGAIVFGAVTNIWNIIIANRNFWVFNYENQSREKIATFGFCEIYSKRYEVIGMIEDLICFYKILLYSQQGEGIRDILVEKAKQKINKSEDRKIRDAILLLCYYFDYEKCYLECEQKMRKERKGKVNVEKIKEKTIKKIKRKNVYDYQEMKTWMKDIEQESAEYQLADSILKHVYKEPEIKEDGTMNPEKLRNYKFEYYFDFIKNKVDKA